MEHQETSRLEYLQHLPLSEALEQLGCYVVLDNEYHPVKDSSSRRYRIVTPDQRHYEILITGGVWWDTRANNGNGGLISLVMHTFGYDFKQTINKLSGAEVFKNSENVQTVRKTEPMQFFNVDGLAFIPKSDIPSMELPLFALKGGNKKPVVYEREGIEVMVVPGYYGHATIHDKDIIIFCVSKLMTAKNIGWDICRTVRFKVYEFLKTIGRGTGGKDYEEFKMAMHRLSQTYITTNFKTAGVTAAAGFGIVDSWRIIEKAEDDKRMVEVEVTLAKWLFGSIENNQVLTLSPDYFKLRKSLERRLYEIVRKHCGQQKSWKVSLPVLHKKSGSTINLRDFRKAFKKVFKDNNLPDYHILFDEETDMVTFVPRKEQKTLTKQKKFS